MTLSMAEVLSPSNPRLKHLRRLVRRADARADAGVMVVEGPVLLREALQSDLPVHEAFAAVDVDPDLVDRLRLAGVPTSIVSAGGLDGVLDTVSPQPVAAVVARPSAELDDLGPDRPVLFLVDVRDPGNVGTLIRTAEAAGCAGVVVAGSSVDVTNPKVVRASAGAMLRLPVVAGVDARASLTWFADRGGRPILATVVDSSAAAYDEVDLRSAVVLLGNEAAGLSPEIRRLTTGEITIPLAGPTESLNVAAAGAVLCFAADQQRRTELAGQQPPQQPGSGR